VLFFGLLWILQHGGEADKAPSATSNQALVSSKTDQSTSRTDAQLSRREPERVTDVRRNLINGQYLEVVTVSAMGLFREYDRNEVATDMRLKGKIVEIQGSITGINKDLWDKAYVTLKTPNEFMSASVRPIESDIDKIARLVKGQLVTFRCEKMQRFMGSPSGSNCALIN
jgi:tRNA_anti-like